MRWHIRAALLVLCAVTVGLAGCAPQGKSLRQERATARETFEEYRRQLDRDGLDVVIVFDSTGSMGGIIFELKTRILQITNVMKRITPNARLGLVAYRDSKKYDLDDYEYTVKYIQLKPMNRDGMKKLQTFLRSCEAYGGGDIPEAVHYGLKAAIDRGGWREKSRKAILIAGDAPPRPEENGLAKTYALAKEWHKTTGGVISCIDTTGNFKVLDEFKEIAHSGGGEAVFLNDEREIIRQVLISAFGTRWSKEIEAQFKHELEHADMLIED